MFKEDNTYPIEHQKDGLKRLSLFMGAYGDSFKESKHLTKMRSCKNLFWKEFSSTFWPTGEALDRGAARFQEKVNCLSRKSHSLVDRLKMFTSKKRILSQCKYQAGFINQYQRKLLL